MPRLRRLLMIRDRGSVEAAKVLLGIPLHCRQKLVTGWFIRLTRTTLWLATRVTQLIALLIGIIHHDAAANAQQSRK